MLEITVVAAEVSEVVIMDGDGRGGNDGGGGDDGRVMEVIMVRIPVEVKQWWRW